MNYLIRKDLLSVKSGIVYIIPLSFLISIAFSSSNPETAVILTTAMLTSLVGSCFAWDAQSNWNLFAVSAGVSRSYMVNRRFLFGFMLVAVGLVTGTLFGLLHAGIRGMPMEPGLYLNNILLSVAMGAIVVSTSCLANYLMESNKAQMVSSLISMVAIMAVVGLGVALNLSGIALNLNIGFQLTIVLLAAVLTAACHRVCIRRFETRDL